MEKNQNFNIALIGNPDENQNIQVLLNTMLGIYKKVYSALNGRANINFITTTKHFNLFWQQFTNMCKCNVICSDARFDRNVKVKSVDNLVSVIRGITENADMIFMLWDEQTESYGGIPWEILKECYQRDKACIWYSLEINRLFWGQEIYFGEFSDSQIKIYIDNLYSENFNKDVKIKGIRNLNLSGKLYNRFLKKFNAENVEISSQQDIVMEEEYSYCDNNENRNKLRKVLKKTFDEYDKRAINYSEKYFSSIYFRAIIPLISTIFLATGFYVEPFLGYFFDIHIGNLSIWAFTGAAAFGLYLIVNIFVYFLSKSRTMAECHRCYIKNRIVAEYLRVMIHFLPSGIYADTSSVFGTYDNMNEIEKETTSKIREIIRSQEICNPDFTSEGKKEIFRNSKCLIDDQIYYLRKTKGRYGKIIKHLKKWSKGIFSATAILLFIRTLFQMAYSLDFLEGLRKFVFPYGGDIDGLTFLIGFSNIIAMIIPAWGSYFISKLEFCNFENHYNEYHNKEQRLIQMKKRVIELERREDVPVNTIYDLADELVEILLEETKSWGDTVKSRKFTKL